VNANRLFAIGVCFGIALTQASRLLAQSEIDLSLLGSGSLTLETVSLQKGSGISVETDLQGIAAIIVEDVSNGRELVRIGTEKVQKELQNRKEGRPESDLTTSADSIRGRFEHHTTYDLRSTTVLRVTLILINGTEIPLIMESRGSIANRRLTRTFDGKTCSTYTQTCSSDTGPTERCSKTCCTDTLCFECFPCQITCGPCDWGGGGCKSAPPAPQQTIAVSLGENPHTVPFPESSFVLSRMEPGNDVSQLMDEWAVASPSGEVLRASSPAFASAIAKDLVEAGRNAPRVEKRGAAEGEDAGEPLLIIEAPVHPHNSRFVPTPTLILTDAEVPGGTSPVRVLVRADFSEEQDSVDGLQILHADGPMPQNLLELLRSRMALDRIPGERHRTVVFALVNIKDVIEITSLAAVLPKCCCGGRWCV
jgi:hypothetical protein